MRVQKAYMQPFLVFIGSGIGGVLRYRFGLLSLRLLGPNFSYGTLAVDASDRP